MSMDLKQADKLHLLLTTAENLRGGLAELDFVFLDVPSHRLLITYFTE